METGGLMDGYMMAVWVDGGWERRRDNKQPAVGVIDSTT